MFILFILGLSVRRLIKMTEADKLILTLDAGGTNFHFSAYENAIEVIEPFTIAADVSVLESALATIVSGFNRLIKSLNKKPVAISFAFPGPANYEKGIINNVGNLPAFAGGVPLGPYLEEVFNVPVFINNDGDLYTYGEARFGVLPWINDQLINSGSSKRFNSLIGLTLGTGYGAGAFLNGQLYCGDNSSALEVWTTRNGIKSNCFTEEGVSKRAIVNYYGDHTLTPEDIFEIAIARKDGDQQRALLAYEEFGKVLGESIADIITLFDTVIVIGGGVSNAHTLFMPTVFKRIRGMISDYNGGDKKRIVQSVYDLENEKELSQFTKGNQITVSIPGSSKTIVYDSESRSGIALSRLGANRAIALGAYAYAIDRLKGTRSL